MVIYLHCAKRGELLDYLISYELTLFVVSKFRFKMLAKFVYRASDDGMIDEYCIRKD
jgi:hypothetical protein